MKKEKLIDLLFFCAFICVCAYPLLINLGAMSVKIWDESRNGVNAMEMLQNHQFFVTHFDGTPDMWNTKPPLFIWTIALSMKLFGITLFALRIPSALSCLVIIASLFWFFRKHYGSIFKGMITGFVMITAVGLVDYHAARNGDFDVMLAMWIVLYSLQFFLYLKNGNRSNLFLFSLFLALAILTKGVAGCLFLPGLFLFMLTDKNNLPFFKRPSFYLIPLAGLLLGVSYYFIREELNPGYIRAVWENELGGRYTETLEGHAAPASYYIGLLAERHFSYWIWFVPLSILFVLLRADRAERKLMLFFAITSVSYLLIISVAGTKLDWYDIPLFPFFGGIIALGIDQLLKEIKHIPGLKHRMADLIVLVLLVALFRKPVKDIFATSIVGTKETYYPEQFYGDFIAGFYSVFPDQKQLTVLSKGFNPHIIYYIRAYSFENRQIRILSPDEVVPEGDTVLICEPLLWSAKAIEGKMFDTLYQEDNNKFVLTYGSGEKGPAAALKMKMNQIRSNTAWFESVKEKARANNIELESQIRNDALWILREEKVLSDEDVSALRSAGQ